MKNKTSTKYPFGQPVNYNAIKPAALSETRVSIHNEQGDVRVINMSSRADGILEIEMHDGQDMPFRYHRG